MPIDMCVKVLPEIPESLLERIYFTIPEDALNIANNGHECVIPVNDTSSEGVVIRFIACKQKHPEERGKQCRVEIVAKIKTGH